MKYQQIDLKNKRLKLWKSNHYSKVIIHDIIKFITLLFMNSKRYGKKHKQLLYCAVGRRRWWPRSCCQWTNPFSIKGRSRYSWIKSTSWHLGHKGNRTKNTSNKRISERGFPAIKTSFASKHIAYLKAKDIKHSNRHLHLAFEYDVIHFADQPTKQLCIYFLCKCIPVKIITHSINFNPRARTVVSESENHNSATRTKVIIRVK